LTVDRTSWLFITIDSCRFDTFVAAHAPHLKGIGTLHRALAPAAFTYASHAAMFVGFTPWVPGAVKPFVNPKFARIFKLAGAGFEGNGREFVRLEGRSIMEGFARLGFVTVGTGAVGWFDPASPTGRLLTGDFDAFHYAGGLREQLAFIDERLAAVGDKPVFVFLNVGETHVPYHFEGAPWDREVNPCRPFADDNDAAECLRRQRACLEWVDEKLGGLLDSFAAANIVACADHGDAWGEDGVWEHGVPHPKVLEVPLLLRLANPPAGTERNELSSQPQRATAPRTASSQSTPTSTARSSR
jgi:hypothetical protein